MDMWLCVRRAINAVERAKKAYDNSRSKVTEAGEVLQDHVVLVKGKEVAERRALEVERKATKAENKDADAEHRTKDAENSLFVARVTLESAKQAMRDAYVANETIQVMLDKS